MRIEKLSALSLFVWVFRFLSELQKNENFVLELSRFRTFGKMQCCERDYQVL